MVLELAIMNEVMEAQAYNLDGVSAEEAQRFGHYLAKITFTEDPVTKEEERLSEKIMKLLNETPSTKFELLKVQKELLELRTKKDYNTKLHGIWFDKDDDLTKKNPMNISMWAVSQVEHTPINLKTDSTIGEIVSGNWLFKLYGKFANYEEKGRSAIRKGKGYPIERVQIPEKSIELDLKIHNQLYPTHFYVGDLSDQCNECLVYAQEQYVDAPGEFHQMVEHRAGFFSILNIKNRLYKDCLRDIETIKQEMVRLEKLIN